MGHGASTLRKEHTAVLRAPAACTYVRSHQPREAEITGCQLDANRKVFAWSLLKTCTASLSSKPHVFCWILGVPELEVAYCKVKPFRSASWRTTPLSACRSSQERRPHIPTYVLVVPIRTSAPYPSPDKGATVRRQGTDSSRSVARSFWDSFRSSILRNVGDKIANFTRVPERYAVVSSSSDSSCNSNRSNSSRYSMLKR